jgi:hypothetical protein
MVEPFQFHAQQSVHWTLGILRHFHLCLRPKIGTMCGTLDRPPGQAGAGKQFLWLEASSVKVALSRPTHQRVTPTVSPLR